MTTKSLSLVDYPYLSPAFGLWSRYDPAAAPLRFQAGTIAQAQEWQKHVRPVLREAIGFTDLESAEMDLRIR
jgi:hypothetical protein